MPIIRIAIVLDLQPLIFGERLHQQRELVLKPIQFLHLRVNHVGRLEEESLRDVAARVQRIENDQVVDEVSVWRFFKHNGCAGCL